MVTYMDTKLLWLTALVVAMCAISLTSGMSLYGMCLTTCSKCSDEFGPRFNAGMCREMCGETNGKSIESSCETGFDVDKRSKESVHICRKYCVSCVLRYGHSYNVAKCANLCMDTEGTSIDPDCMNMDIWNTNFRRRNN
ncbi:uncharacterized protein LOC132550542 [Ylistrum balloti]|uniref:uncharacterized protein LOC132550542 n=1 Tax=Ylistrum balloti TaxID=509963 RepID=UPI002905C92B|nr:uncharacterized protein LOC132550542 [Ylistrum balloti]